MLDFKNSINCLKYYFYLTGTSQNIYFPFIQKVCYIVFIMKEFTIKTINKATIYSEILETHCIFVPSLISSK